MKQKRQEKILELILQYDIETQEELLDLLQQAGFSVTQATISRDIRELRLIKTSDAGAKHKYVSLLHQPQGVQGNFSDKYLRVFREGFLSADTAQNILVVKTVSGMAMAVAAALDAMNYKEIVGSIAGDDTIMCAVRTAQDALYIREQLTLLAKP